MSNGTARGARLLRRLHEMAAAGPASAVGGLEPAPLTGAQTGLWVIDQLDPGASDYNVPQVYRFRGALDAAALGIALDATIARQAALRTVFDFDGDETVQRFDGPVGPLRIVDLTHLRGAEQDAELRRELDTEASAGFDLAAGPLIRAVLIRLSPAEHVLMLTIHHIVFDGTSAGVLIGDLSAAYRAAVTGQPADLPPITETFADYARWHQDWLAGADCRRERDYWLTRLAGRPAPVDLATKPRRRNAAVPGEPVQLWLPDTGDGNGGLAATCHRSGVTRFMVLLSALSVALARRTGCRDLLIATPMVNRPLPYTRHLVGYFVNLVLLRIDLSGEPTYGELLGRARETVVAGAEHQTFPYSELVDHLEPDRDDTAPPLAPVTLVLQDSAWDAGGDWPGLDVQFEEQIADGTVTDVTLSVSHQPEQLHVEFSFRADICDRADIEHLATAFQSAVEEFTADLSRPVPLGG
ncbi:condensation domain-containing protein [Pseudosporangium ferrugineum]|uniref:Condensation domain-containing protein n=1 Tax=Pseudosporangium ferrugineum TaxID=439699 RepID=A0A2T0RFI3_9ACTN|nr:condensation domain-containing protein [Pseudosporangium ferrugineum]PRY19881.1 condensation domain-containing protein [Pseudosporangium ferrugineum]